MNDFVVYQHFIFSEFNRSWMFSKQFLLIVITLQVLHIIFKGFQIYKNYTWALIYRDRPSCEKFQAMNRYPLSNKKNEIIKIKVPFVHLYYIFLEN